MDAKKRYRKRLKLQSALARVMEVLADNVGDGIPPERTTALMAWQVVEKLLPFVKESGLDVEELLDKPGGADFSRFVYLFNVKREETYERGLRRKRARKEG